MWHVCNGQVQSYVEAAPEDYEWKEQSLNMYKWEPPVKLFCENIMQLDVPIDVEATLLSRGHVITLPDIVLESCRVATVSGHVLRVANSVRPPPPKKALRLSGSSWLALVNAVPHVMPVPSYVGQMLGLHWQGYAWDRVMGNSIPDNEHSDSDDDGEEPQSSRYT